MTNTNPAPVDELIGKIRHRRRAVMRDWVPFQRDASPFLVAEIIERRKACLPDDLAPWAPAIVLAGDYLLRAANYRPGVRRSRGWRRDSNVFLKFPEGHPYLRVRRCGRYWTVERTIKTQEGEILVYSFGALPIFTRTYQAATRLADYCNPNTHGAAAGLRWVREDIAKCFGYPQGGWAATAVQQSIQDAALGN